MPPPLPSRARLGVVFVGLVVLATIGWTHAQFLVIATGDGYAVYFPVVWDLLDGKGAASFDRLAWGYFRMPGYSVALYLATLVVGQVGRAVTALALVSVVALLVPLWRLAGRELRAPFAAALFFGSNCFLNTIFVSTPDLVCFALHARAFHLAFFGSGSRRWFIVGVLAGAAILLRLNSVGLVLFFAFACWGEDRWRAVGRVLAGASVPLSIWVVFSLSTRGQLFWIPGGPTGLAVRVFHASVLAESNDLWSAIREAPLAMAAKIFVRSVASGPLDVAWEAAGPLPALLCLTALPALLRLPRRTWILGALFLALVWGPMALSGFEARYFPLLVALLCWGGGGTLAKVVDLVPASFPRDLIAGGLLVALFAARAPALPAHLEPHRRAGRFIETIVPLEEAASTFPPGCIGTEEITFRMTAFRYLMRLHGRDRLCCCGIDKAQSGFVRLKGYGEVTDADLALFERIEPEGATPLVELFRVEQRLPSPEIDAGRSGEDEAHR